MRRVGVLGGTFDPPHLGHLRAAEVARDALQLERVVFVPAASPPHKSDDSVTDAPHRARMMESALSDIEGFELSRVELSRDGPSYTIDTLDELHAPDSESELWFITGSDAFSEIRTWKRWDELLSRYSFVVLERPGFDVDVSLAVIPEPLRDRVGSGPGEGASIVFLRREMLNVSSSKIRQSVAEAHSIRFLVPSVVEDYIREHLLYQ